MFEKFNEASLVFTTYQQQQQQHISNTFKYVCPLAVYRSPRSKWSWVLGDCRLRLLEYMHAVSVRGVEQIFCVRHPASTARVPDHRRKWCEVSTQDQHGWAPETSSADPRAGDFEFRIVCLVLFVKRSKEGARCKNISCLEMYTRMFSNYM